MEEVATEEKAQPELALNDTTAPQVVTEQAPPVVEASVQPLDSPRREQETPSQVAKAPEVPKNEPDPEEVAEDPSKSALERLQQAAEKYEREASLLSQRRAADEEKSRVNYLRNCGINKGLSDAHIAAIAPDANPETVEGKARLDEFVERHTPSQHGDHGLFEQRSMAASATLEEISMDIPTNTSFAGKDLLMATLKRMTRND